MDTVKRKRPELAAEAARRNRIQASTAGGRIVAARRRRHLTQARLAARVGLSRASVSAIERGFGGSHTLDTWQRLAVALEIAFVFDIGRDALEEPLDAGHLKIQELVLRLGRATGNHGSFELVTRPADGRRSVDVGLRDDARRRLILVECWNSIGDLGAAARSTSRKLAEVEDLAVALGGEDPYAVAGCWVVRATKANRDLVARYPAIFAARFPGSSSRWVAALTTGAPPPREPGLVWCDVGATRLFAWRRRTGRSAV
jgi:transcriptional regulator with XRE-family HTH domain